MKLVRLSNWNSPFVPRWTMTVSGSWLVCANSSMTVVYVVDLHALLCDDLESQRRERLVGTEHDGVAERDACG